MIDEPRMLAEADFARALRGLIAERQQTVVDTLRLRIRAGRNPDGSR